MSILTDFNPKFLPFSLVRDVFIDTGMADFAEIGDGCSIRNVVHAKFSTEFPTVHGIEISKRLFGDAVRRLVTIADGGYFVKDDKAGAFCKQKAVLFTHGSSPDVLPLILEPQLATTVFCDAHFQGTHADEMDPKHGQCPLLAELRVIMDVDWRVKPIILIDDAAQFTNAGSWWEKYGGPFKRSDWPRFEQILDLLPGANVLIASGVIYAWWDS